MVNRGDFNRSIRSPGRGMIGLSGDGGVGEISTGVERVELLAILHLCVPSVFDPSFFVGCFFVVMVLVVELR